jgi:alpha-galactosidase
LRGLDPRGIYSIHAKQGTLADTTVQRASGEFWMNHGFDVTLRGDFQAAYFTLVREAAQ